MIFVAVIGAGLLTVVLAIQGVCDPPDFQNGKAEDYRLRLLVIVQHQFFILFAPLGGIFLYQLVLIGGAATEPVTVAIVILGAGATLNALLARAVRSAGQWLEESSKKPTP